MLHNIVSYRKVDHKAFIDFTRPAYGIEAILRVGEELNDICSSISGDEEVWVTAIIGSSDNSFSWGSDYVDNTRAAGEGLGRLSSVFPALDKLDCPVVIGISGDAVGLGLELALACDMRIAANGSHFGLLHIKGGLIPFAGGTQRLSRLVGKSKALELILTGDRIDSQEALRIGLVNKVVPKEEVLKAAMAIVEEMASKCPIALRYAKEAVLKGMDMTLEQGLRLEADLYLLIHTTKDRTEGITAFQQKKRPQFEGK